MGFVYLGLAIVLELLGTTFLKYTLGFTKLSPSLVVVAAYTGAFYFLSRSLQFIDLNIAYATWAGIGVVAAAIKGLFYLGKPVKGAPIFSRALLAACCSASFFVLPSPEPICLPLTETMVAKCLLCSGPLEPISS